MKWVQDPLALLSWTRTDKLVLDMLKLQWLQGQGSGRVKDKDFLGQWNDPAWYWDDGYMTVYICQTQRTVQYEE